VQDSDGLPLPCKACPKGRWSSAQGVEKESLCDNCSPGRYGSQNGGADNEASCVGCAEGTFSEAVGAWEISTCKSCPAGFYIGETGLTYCLPCQVSHSFRAVTLFFVLFQNIHL
jgi:hypothetical protein